MGKSGPLLRIPFDLTEFKDPNLSFLISPLMQYIINHKTFDLFPFYPMYFVSYIGTQRSVVVPKFCLQGSERTDILSENSH